MRPPGGHGVAHESNVFPPTSTFSQGVHVSHDPGIFRIYVRNGDHLDLWTFQSR